MLSFIRGAKKTNNVNSVTTQSTTTQCPLKKGDTVQVITSNGTTCPIAHKYKGHYALVVELQQRQKKTIVFTNYHGEVQKSYDLKPQNNVQIQVYNSFTPVLVQTDIANLKRVSMS